VVSDPPIRPNTRLAGRKACPMDKSPPWIRRESALTITASYEVPYSTQGHRTSATNSMEQLR
jgi:hypothetical protein